MPVSVFAPGSPIAADYAAALAPIIGTPEPGAQVSAEHHATA
jgi:chromosome partitioning protein